MTIYTQLYGYDTLTTSSIGHSRNYELFASEKVLGYLSCKVHSFQFYDWNEWTLHDKDPNTSSRSSEVNSS